MALIDCVVKKCKDFYKNEWQRESHRKSNLVSYSGFVRDAVSSVPDHRDNGFPAWQLRSAGSSDNVQHSYTTDKHLLCFFAVASEGWGVLHRGSGGIQSVWRELCCVTLSEQPAKLFSANPCNRLAPEAYHGRNPCVDGQASVPGRGACRTHLLTSGCTLGQRDAWVPTTTSLERGISDPQLDAAHQL